MPAIRRARLAEWMSTKGLSKAEMDRFYGVASSYTYQLLTGRSPFREVAARNLEHQLKMTPGYLDMRSGRDPDLLSTQFSRIESEQVKKMVLRAAELGADQQISDQDASMFLAIMERIAQYDARPPGAHQSQDKPPGSK